LVWRTLVHYKSF